MINSIKLRHLPVVMLMCYILITMVSCSGSTKGQANNSSDLVNDTDIIITANGEQDDNRYLHIPVMRNDDFDNVRDRRKKPQIDWNVQGYEDDDLVPITVTLSNGKSGTVMVDKDDRWKCGDIPCPLVFKFWDDAHKTKELNLPFEIPSSKMPFTFYAEAEPFTAAGVGFPNIFSTQGTGVTFYLKGEVDKVEEGIFLHPVSILAFDVKTLSDDPSRERLSYPVHRWVDMSSGFALLLTGWDRFSSEWVINESSYVLSSGKSGYFLFDEEGNSFTHDKNVQGFIIESKPLRPNTHRYDIKARVNLAGNWFEKTIRAAKNYWEGAPLLSVEFESRNADVKRIAEQNGLPTIPEERWGNIGAAWRYETAPYGLTEDPTNNRIQYCKNGTNEMVQNALGFVISNSVTSKPLYLCITEKLWNQDGTEEALLQVLKHENRHLEQNDAIVRNEPEGNIFHDVFVALGSEGNFIKEIDAHARDILSEGESYYGVSLFIGHFGGEYTVTVETVNEDGSIMQTEEEKHTYWSRAIAKLGEFGTNELNESVLNFLLDVYASFPWDDLKVGWYGEKPMIPFPEGQDDI